MIEDEQEYEITEEDKEIMRNATTKQCPDCGCVKVYKLEPLSPPYDEVLCECTNKQWSILTDASKEL